MSEATVCGVSLRAVVAVRKHPTLAASCFPRCDVDVTLRSRVKTLSRNRGLRSQGSPKKLEGVLCHIPFTRGPRLGIVRGDSDQVSTT